MPIIFRPFRNVAQSPNPPQLTDQLVGVPAGATAATPDVLFTLNQIAATLGPVITPAIATTSKPGIVQPDGTTITITPSGVISTAGAVASVSNTDGSLIIAPITGAVVAAVHLANPTGVAGPTAVNGTATTSMRSDAAPAVQLGTATRPGILQPDGSTITVNASGVISGASGALAGLTDVAISGATDGQVLCFNGPASKWKNDQRIYGAPGSGTGAGAKVTIKGGLGGTAGRGGYVGIYGGSGGSGQAGGYTVISGGNPGTLPIAHGTSTAAANIFLAPPNAAGTLGGKLSMYGGSPQGAGKGYGADIYLYGGNSNGAGGVGRLRGGIARTSGQSGGGFLINGGNGIVAGAGGGAMNLYGGNGQTSGTAGSVKISGGSVAGVGTGGGGAASLYGGNGASTGVGGNIKIAAGTGGSTSGVGGNVAIYGGNSTAIGSGGQVRIFGGNAGALPTPATSPASSLVLNGSATGGAGGVLSLYGGSARGAGNGGYIGMYGGSAGAGYGGKINLSGGPGHTGGPIYLFAGNSVVGGTAAAGARMACFGGHYNANGGSVQNYGGNAGGGGNGGPVLFVAGNGNGAGAGGYCHLFSGAGGSVGSGGEIDITSGAGGTGGGGGGIVRLKCGNGGGNGIGGRLYINAGNSNNGYVKGAGAYLQGGQAANGGLMLFYGGGVNTGNGAGGACSFFGGGGHGTGAGGGVGLYGGTGGTGAGVGGNVKLYGGASGTATAGGNIILKVGSSAGGTGVVGQISLQGLTGGTFAQTATLTNAPAATNPQFWIPVLIGAVKYWIPAWHT